MVWLGRLEVSYDNLPIFDKWRLLLLELRAPCCTIGLMQEEKWLPVVGWEGLYEVSDCGRVRSVLRRSIYKGRRTGGKMLKPYTNKRRKHLTVNLSGREHGKGKLRPIFIHRIVLEAFVGPAPAGMIARHRDGDGGNNLLSNLAWGTHKENSADSLVHGVQPIGSNHKKAKLKEADIPLIRADIASGKSWKEIALVFGVSSWTIRNIDAGKVWRSVT